MPQSNNTVGHSAEKRAAEFLRKHGYDIRMLNWKTRYCEIDIVAQKNKTIYMVEVKYRRSSSQGYGTDYITTKKLKRMQFAAEMWVQEHAWGGEYQLAAVSIDGYHMEFLDDL